MKTVVSEDSSHRARLMAYLRNTYHFQQLVWIVSWPWQAPCQRRPLRSQRQNRRRRAHLPPLLPLWLVEFYLKKACTAKRKKCSWKKMGRAKLKQPIGGWTRVETCTWYSILCIGKDLQPKANIFSSFHHLTFFDFLVSDFYDLMGHVMRWHDMRWGVLYQHFPILEK